MISLNNKQRLLLLLLSSILFGLGWLTKGFSLFIALVPLLIVEDYFTAHKEKYKSRTIFSLSYLVFFVWHIITNWWVGYASIIGLILANLLNAVFYALIFWMFHIFHRKLSKGSAYLFLVISWLGFEYIHTFWELSWPWMDLGNWLGKSIYFIQWYEYTGVQGGSLWILLINLLIFAVINLSTSENKRLYNSTLISLIALFIVPIVISVIIFIRYKEKENPVDIVAVQPNIDPYSEKYDRTTYDIQLQNIINLFDSVGDENVDYYVAPETAIPKGIWENNITTDPSVLALRNFLSNSPKSKIIIGMASYKLFLPGEKLSITARAFRGTDNYYDRYNAAVQIDTSNNLQIYHKSKLVVGVEKMPFLHLFPWVENLALDFGGIIGSLGIDEERKAFNSDNSNTKVGPIICYESIYGEFVTEYIKKGANILLVITNDGWWENTPGHRQHLMHSQLRAIETRRSLARSANTGISCFINQRGQISQATKYWVKDAIREKINANDEITFYVKFGDMIGRISMFLSVLFLIYGLVKLIVPVK
jgi:apolipoprotein N-acyltransferase